MSEAKTVTRARTKRGGRPTRDESERLAAEIVEAARRLFIEQGLVATTMEQVIAACGIGKDTLYRRFSTKEALFAAVVEKARTRTLALLEAADRESPEAPLERVRHLARWFLDVNLDPELLALKREAVLVAMRDRTAAREDPFTPKLSDAIAAAAEAGALSAPDPDFTAAQLIAAVVLGPNNDALMGETALSDPDARTAWFEKAWRLFINGAGADGGRS